ncbi:response regulator transcription factor [Microbispora siamensis]|uniref:response regulator transcription factor n=1 Tax=Microbispora siamensis TaxID=564413 RepID=UPI00194EF51D|nr:response regulator transcription factor [Microbispora siamensis]
MGASVTCRRVVVVDDDDISRVGLAAILTATPGITVTAALDHDQAIGADAWLDADVALIDAADERRDDDQFPGVSVVQHIRSGGRPTTIIVMTGHFFDGAIRRRMREAGADLFYHRAELADAQALRATVLGLSGRPVPCPEDPEEEIRLGVSSVSRVNAAVRYAVERRLPELLAERANPRSRAWERLRREFNGHARLLAMTCDGRVPDREQELPSLPQISRFLRWATRVKVRFPGADD